MNASPFKSIGSKLNRILFITSILTLLAVSTFFTLYEISSLHPRMIRTAQEDLLLLEESLRPALVFEDAGSATQFLETLRGHSGISAVFVYNEKGTLFASYKASDCLLQAPHLASPVPPDFDGGYLKYWHPLFDYQKHQGDLLLCIRTPAWSKRVPDYLFTLLAVSLSLLIVSLLLKRGLQRSILSPIAELSSMASGVATKADYSARAKLGSNDEIGQLALSINDMLTVISRREAELLKTYGQIRSIFDAASEVLIVATDLNGLVTHFSTGAERKTGYTAREVVGYQTPLLWHKSAELKQRAAELSEQMGTALEGFAFFKTLCEKSDNQFQEWSFIRKDNSILRVHLVLSTIRDEAGTVTGYLGIGTDISKLIQLEENLRQSQKMEAVGQLAGGIAHDFNNILAAMLLNLGLIDKPQLDPETLETLTELEREAQRAAALTRQLLMFSRRSMMQLAPLELGSCLSGMAKMLTRIIGEDIKLELKIPSEPALANADSGMIEQVIMNLAVNARDAMPEGGQLIITLDQLRVEKLDIQEASSLSPGLFTRIQVFDTGCGMDEATRARIFEPFFTTKEVGKGTGLGLATVHGIIRQHNGWLTVSSQVGKGTCFCVYLPVLVSETVQTQAAPKNDHLHGGQGTILLVEDEQCVRHVTALFLRKRGYEVLEASSGTEALSLWSKYWDKIDLLYTDMVMPDRISGMDLASRLQGEKPSLRILLTSGYSADLTRRDLGALKGLMFLQKPCETQVIAQTVHDCLNKPLSEW